MINVALFEDHPVVLRSLESFLNEQGNITVVFSAKAKAELYGNLNQDSDIDVVIVDLLGIDVRGLEVYEYLNKNYPDIKMIAFTSLASAVLVENLLAVGVKGYVNKNQDLEDLPRVIESVYNGHISVPEDYSFLVKRPTEPHKVTLSERETEIVNFIALEYTTTDIAAQLGISVNTVENHRKSIFQKLDVKNVAGMMREVARLGYLS